ncbi:hypothetical protein Arub01_42920 [Actinomadura rubrobrunea]|uniref:Uncharacterized protein n=1 Tax=Actinomadura rubrobrunea TaxID=115335 RepID=A0A9W6UXF3_9ACTN|nr:hypothetical protein Arub01_42920 [Actinomadura rubrobrunea]
MQHGSPGAPLFWDKWRIAAAARGVRLPCYARPGYAVASVPCLPHLPVPAGHS